MIKKIKQWFEKRRIERHYASGYAWAMRKFYNNKKNTAYITGFVETAKMLGDYDEFDKGAEDALKVIEKRSAL